MITLISVIFLNVAIFTGSPVVILAAGLVTALHALEGDVAMSDDHPLVKQQGLPL